LMSLVGLVLAGEVSQRSLELTAVLIPSVLLGIMTAKRVKQRLNADLVRPVILALCLLSAIALLVRSLA
ncbi:MAG: hypothetical protein P8N13_03850, partial [Ilumatobacter sp.]|nr:hypothetical protein [Ilumatobacter sp.]